VASNWLKKKVEKSPIWKSKKIYLVPFGVDTNLFKPGDSESEKKALNIPINDVVLMFRSDTWEYKGLDIIINALENIENSMNVSIITVGKKGLINDLKGKFKIFEYGWVDNDTTMVALYKACDIFLMPSKQETFGLMAVEAMCCGKMVLTIEGEGTALPDVINSPECGLAVSESNYPAELARLIDNRFEVMDRGNKSADYSRMNYSKEKYVKAIIDIYDEVINEHIIDENGKHLFEQLSKYAKNDFTINQNMNIEIIQSVIAKSGSIKKAIRLFARITWKVIKFLRLNRLIRKSGIYKKMEIKGIISKLRG
jgi:glycosyltransferase involved in cell wall biosynthesis